MTLFSFSSSLSSSSLLLFLALGLSVACTTPVDPETRDAAITDARSDVDAPVDLTVCETQHEEMLGDVRIVVCDAAFATAPLVRLPADTSSGGVDTVYGGLARSSTGPDVVLVGRAGEVSLAASGTTPAWLAAESTAPLPRYAYYLYRARVQGGEALEVTPIVRIEGVVFDRILAGLVFEGVASRRESDGTYAVADRDVPIRIRLDGSVEEGVAGTIENATAAVTGADGTCLASLESLGDASPLFGRTGDRVRIARYPAMHFPFDDVFVFAWSAADPVGMNMGGGLFVAPSDLIQSVAPQPVDGSNAPHGNPSSGPSATLTVVSGGAEACTP